MWSHRSHRFPCPPFSPLVDFALPGIAVSLSKTYAFQPECLGMGKKKECVFKAFESFHSSGTRIKNVRMAGLVTI